MKPNDTNIEKFFRDNYQIPIYQRAYSWDKAQWSVFLADLQEAAKGSNHYFFGNVLLEKDINDMHDIIDGQQRITTIIIFVRALCNVLSQKKDKLSDKIDNAVFIKQIEEDYLIYRGKPKLKAVEYDEIYFNGLIIENKAMSKPQTPSQTRIKEAKDFFEKELKKNSDTKILLKLFETMQKAQILSITFENKKDSVLMFELQNNRGKDLTYMEKLKSYLAYQIYTYCGDKAESKLNETTNYFKEIYRIVKDIDLDEDDLLNYFNISKSKFGFAYREKDDTLNYKRELKDEVDKIAWIDDYVKELRNAFVDFKEFKKCKSIYREYLQYLDVVETYPFILKAYRLFRDNKDKLEQVFQALEIMAFRHRLTKRGASLSSRLNKVIKDFDSIDSLIKGLKDVCSEMEWYWSDKEIMWNSLIVAYEKYDKEHSKEKSALPYLFMRYENALRGEDALSRGYKFKLKEIENTQIEHISPQTETIEESGKKLESGYYCDKDGKYDDIFLKEYIHCIGNLMLISKSHNCSIGNEPFKIKLASYKKSPLAQHREVKNFVVNKGMWDKDAIDKRHAELEKFVLETWSFE